jgi:hypothetical protein
MSHPFSLIRQINQCYFLPILSNKQHLRNNLTHQIPSAFFSFHHMFLFFSLIS